MDYGKEIIAGAFAAVSGAIAWVWRKVDNSASKQDLKDAIDVCEASNDTLRDSTIKLFENAENDRRRFEERFSKMQDTIHGIHVEVLSKLNRK